MLRPGINPLDRRMGSGMKTMEVRDQHYSFPSAKEMERRMGPGMTNMGGIPAAPGMTPGMIMTGGFDASDLMKTPGMIQQSTRDQAEKVSAPYREANMMAADKTNPMNAASQEPGKSFLMKRFVCKELRL